MDIQLYCNSSCQTSRVYEALSKLPWTKGYLKVNEIPNEDVKLSCEEFELKYKVQKFPFAKVDGNIVDYKNLHNFIYDDFAKGFLGIKFKETIHT